jgi:glycosyltransferase involved in cell wall biosynthesis
VAVYCDLRYQLRGGVLYCDESFACFAAELAGHVGRLIVAGRLDTARTRRFVHPLRSDVEFAALPDYPSLSRAVPAARAMLRSLARVWRMLGEVDAVWVLGPHPLAVACTAMALVRRRRVVLGVRENFVAYVALRHPARPARAAAWALDRLWRALARVVPVVVVGSELAHRYRRAPTLLPIVVSLVGVDGRPQRAAAPDRDYDSELEVLSVGRLDPEKNPLLLADILAALRTRRARWRLSIHGSGSLEEALALRLEELGVREHAILGGHVGAAELSMRYQAAHALLHVSWSEGVPQVLFEAWAAGLPVVATDVGGVADAAGPAALLIPPGDASSAVDALELLAGDPQLRGRLVAAGHERARRHAAPEECGRVAALLRGEPDATSGGVRPPHRHAWVWVVLAPETRRVLTAADRDLEATLEPAGIRVTGAEADEAPQALLVDAALAGARAAVAVAADAPANALVAVAFGGGSPGVLDGQSRAARVLELLLSPVQATSAAVHASRLARSLRRRGLSVATYATGERTRAYGLGPGGVRRRRRLPVGRLVVAAQGGLPPSFVDRAIAAASQHVGAPLRRDSVTVTQSAKLVVELRDPLGRRFVLHVAAGRARALQERSSVRLAELESDALAPALRSRVPWPIARGETGAALWVLEPRAAGRHPRRMTGRLWRECLDVLVELHGCARDGAEPDGPSSELSEQARAIGLHVDAALAVALSRIANRLADRLADAPLGWAHGDMWPDNLLVRRGRLNVIIDWDWASRRSLPMLDLIDLIASTERGRRGEPPGPRFLRLVWPLARSGGDDRMRAYAHRTGTPADAGTLEALAVASWLAHVARDLLPFAHRQRAAWLEQNVGDPVRALERAGW